MRIQLLSRYTLRAAILASALVVFPAISSTIVHASREPLPAPGDASADFAARSQQIEERAEEFLQALLEKRFEDARQMLVADLAAELSAEDIQERWDAINASVGDLQDRGEIRYEWAVNTDFVVMELNFEQTSGDVILSFNNEQMITGVDFPPLREADARIVAENMIDALASKNYLEARKDLHPILKDELTPEAIAQKWQGLQQVTGSFRRRVGTQIRKTDEFQLVTIALEFENQTEDMIIFLNSENQVLGVDFPL